MIEKNEGLIIELEKLEKGSYTGQTIIHWNKGQALLLDFPKRPLRKQIDLNIGSSLKSK